MNETIGSRIGKYRRERKLTQEELARRLRISSQAVSKWETDTSCPDISLLPQLCQVLEISCDTLLTGKEDTVRMLPEEARKSLDALTLRVKVLSAAGDKVRVNLPMSLVKACLELGLEIAPAVGGSQVLQNLDLGKILALAERGAIGKLAEVETAGGDLVEVIVE